MGGKKWSKKEIDFLIRNKDILSCKEIAEEIKRTLSSVGSKLSDLKLNKAYILNSENKKIKNDLTGLVQMVLKK